MNLKPVMTNIEMARILIGLPIHPTIFGGTWVPRRPMYQNTYVTNQPTGRQVFFEILYSERSLLIRWNEVIVM